MFILWLLALSGSRSDVLFVCFLRRRNHQPCCGSIPPRCRVHGGPSGPGNSGPRSSAGAAVTGSHGLGILHNADRFPEFRRLEVQAEGAGGAGPSRGLSPGCRGPSPRCVPPWSFLCTSVSVSVRVASSPKDTCHRGPGPLPGPRSPVITPLKARLRMQSRSQVSGVELGHADFGARHLAPNGVLPPGERLLSYFLGSSSLCFLGFLSRISVLSRLALRDRPPCLPPHPPRLPRLLPLSSVFHCGGPVGVSMETHIVSHFRSSIC